MSEYDKELFSQATLDKLPWMAKDNNSRKGGGGGAGGGGRWRDLERKPLGARHAT